MIDIQQFASYYPGLTSLGIRALLGMTFLYQKYLYEVGSKTLLDVPKYGINHKCHYVETKTSPIIACPFPSIQSLQPAKRTRPRRSIPNDTMLFQECMSVTRSATVIIPIPTVIPKGVERTTVGSPQINPHHFHIMPRKKEACKPLGKDEQKRKKKSSLSPESS